MVDLNYNVFCFLLRNYTLLSFWLCLIYKELFKIFSFFSF